MVMNRTAFKKSLEKGLNTQFGLEYRQHPEEWRDLFKVDSSAKAYEEDVLLVGLGLAQVKGEGRGVSYDSGSEAWVARYNHETIALAFAITEEAEEDGLYGSLGSKYAKSLARSLQQTKEVKGASVFNFGFDSSYTGGDGKPLFATDHPLAGGGTASNALATPADLSEASLEDLLNQIDRAVDDRNLPVDITGVKLAIPIGSQFIAERLMKSMLRTGTSDNDINAIKSKGMLPGGYTTNRRFTDTDAFFIITDCMDGLKHFVRRNVRRGVEGDFETGNMRYKASERYSFGWTNWRGSFGSQGS